MVGGSDASFGAIAASNVLYTHLEQVSLQGIHRSRVILPLLSLSLSDRIEKGSDNSPAAIFSLF
jgi:hypothetical protein